MPSRIAQTCYISTVLFLALTVFAADPGAGTVIQASPSKVVMVDDFESYTNDQQLAKAWYKPPHGGGIHQSRESTIKNGGNFSLKVEYSTTQSTDKFYSTICRVAQWNLAGCNALQFWLKPDGSGRALLVDLNIANKEGKNIHDLWDYTYVPKKGDTTPRIVSVPFSKLVKNAKYADSPDTSPVFKPEALIEVALCIGGRNDEPGDGVYYFDDFQGVSVKPE
jgi:mannan endo-1,4-beta-mannosidase